MAHLWLFHDDAWAIFALADGRYDLTTLPPRRLGDAESASAVLLFTGNEWLLLAEPLAPVRVNGLPVMGNIHVMADRDEISVGGARVFFSAETLASIQEYAGQDVRCPRCKLEVKAGQPSVRCPGCKAVHHDACWEYAPACALCPAPTALDAGYQFTPEAL